MAKNKRQAKSTQKKKQEEETKVKEEPKEVSKEPEENLSTVQVQVDKDFLNQVNRGKWSLAEVLIMSTAREDSNIYLWDPKNRSMLMKFIDVKLKSAANTLCTTNEYGGVIITCQESKTQVTCWQYDATSEPYKFQVKEELTEVKPIYQGMYIVGGSKSGNLYIWNCQNGNLLAEMFAHNESISSMCPSEDSSLLLTACIGGTAKLWILGDIISSRGEDGASPWVEFKGHTDSITKVVINKFTSRAYTSSLDKTCKIWDLFTGIPMKTFTLISGITAMVVDSMESTIYFGCKNKNVYIAAIESFNGAQSAQPKKFKKTLIQQKNEITCITLNMSEDRLIVGTSDGVIYIYSNLEGEEVMLPLEIHKDKGPVTNLVPILRPMCLLGLNTNIKDTAKLPFLSSKGERCVFDKACKEEDKEQISEFLLPTEKLNLFEIAEDMKNNGSNYDYSRYLGNDNIEEDYWKFVTTKTEILKSTPETEAENDVAGNASEQNQNAGKKDAPRNNEAADQELSRNSVEEYNRAKKLLAIIKKSLA